VSRFRTGHNSTEIRSGEHTSDSLSPIACGSFFLCEFNATFRPRRYTVGCNYLTIFTPRGAEFSHGLTADSICPDQQRSPRLSTTVMTLLHQIQRYRLFRSHILSVVTMYHRILLVPRGKNVRPELYSSLGVYHVGSSVIVHCPYSDFRLGYGFDCQVGLLSHTI
jgi:hypothetical protein